MTLHQKVKDGIQAGRQWPFIVYTDEGMTHDMRIVESVYKELVEKGVRPLRRGTRAWNRRQKRGVQRLTHAIGKRLYPSTLGFNPASALKNTKESP